MGKGESGGGGEMRAKVGLRWRCQSTKIHQCHPVPKWRDFFRAKNFFVDDNNGLSAIGSVDRIFMMITMGAC